MEFAYERIESLPKLAWCARVEGRSDVVTVLHGPGVETRPDFFIEGAWDGPFEAGEIDQSSVLMGTGGRVHSDHVVFCPPGHTLDRLFHIRRHGRVYLSNSLPFLLRQAGLSLNLAYRYYLADLCSVRYGLRSCVSEFPTAEHVSVHIQYHHNLRLDANLDVSVQEKALPPAFEDFGAYRHYLAGSLRGVCDNAAASGRRVQYDEMVATLSSGYDATCCASLAAEAGCKRGVTFRDRQDSGRPVGEALGMEVSELDAGRYRAMTGTPEAELVSCGEISQIYWAGLEDIVRQRIVLTGFQGDRIWGRFVHGLSRDIVRGSPPGAGLAEFRLRVGFVHVPLPFVGCRRELEVHRITALPEMRPWLLGTRYDRPIPRRIAESMGVPRAAFGQCKKNQATGTIYKRLSSGSKAAFEEFYRAHRYHQGVLGTLWHNVVFCTKGLWARVCVMVEQLLRKVGCDIELPRLPLPKHSYRAGRLSFVVQWGASMVIDRYSGADAK